MKKSICTAFLAVLFMACSSDSETLTEETNTPFEVNLSPSSLTLDVDEAAVVDINTESSLAEIKWLTAVGSKSISAFDGGKLEENLKLYFQFAFPGNHPVTLEFKDTEGEILTKHLNFEVVARNTVHVTQIEVLNFYDIGEAWDPEASGEDKLADVVWTLEKSRLTGFSKEEYRLGFWYNSEVHENESSLTWDLTNENLYLNPVFGFYFAMQDVDEGGIGQNLLLDQLSYKIELRDKLADKPSTVELIDEAVNLHIVFHLSWP